MAKKTCIKCGRTKDQSLGFYSYRNGEKAQICKECMLSHVNIWQEDTYLWLLEKMDVPYVPQQWNSLREKAYAKNPKKQNDTTVFGKYLSKMKLNQFKNCGWADSERLQQERNAADAVKAEQDKTEQELVRQQFENGQITEAQYRTLVNADIQKKYDYQQMLKNAQQRNAAAVGNGNLYNEKNFMAEEDIPDLAQDLTQQDKKRLVIKWGRYYTPQEWIQLQAFYQEMLDSFDIQDADTRSTLILICKNNLKMNQAIDQGDLEGYQKLARVSDTLRKSAKFTAAQNKEQKSQFIDSIGQLVEYCEKNGGRIPKYQIKVDYDIIDKVIKDLKEYNKTLIYEDTALARQIEQYLKKRQNADQHKRDQQAAAAMGLDVVEVTDQDIQKYNNHILQQKQKDNDLIEELKEGK